MPALHALNGDPARAATATADLRRIGAALAPATAAVRAAFSTLDQHAGLLAYDWAPGPGFHWRTATTVDALPLLNGLEAATKTAAALRPDRSALAPAGLPSTRRPHETPGHIVDLTEAIDRRRSELAREPQAPARTLAALSAVRSPIPTGAPDQVGAGPIVR